MDSSSQWPRRLRNCHNIHDLRRLAKLILPFPIYDHIDGGADDVVVVSKQPRCFQSVLLARPPMYRVGTQWGRSDVRLTLTAPRRRHFTGPGLRKIWPRPRPCMVMRSPPLFAQLPAQ
jgi:hypothetical protein